MQICWGETTEQADELVKFPNNFHNLVQSEEYLCGNSYTQAARLQSDPEISEIRLSLKLVQLVRGVS